MKTASWVIQHKETGKVLFETFVPPSDQLLHEQGLEAIPIGKYLGDINKKMRGEHV